MPLQQLLVCLFHLPKSVRHVTTQQMSSERHYVISFKSHSLTESERGFRSVNSFIFDYFNIICLLRNSLYIGRLKCDRAIRNNQIWLYLEISSTCCRCTFLVSRHLSWYINQERPWSVRWRSPMLMEISIGYNISSTNLRVSIHINCPHFP